MPDEKSDSRPSEVRGNQESWEKRTNRTETECIVGTWRKLPIHLHGYLRKHGPGKDTGVQGNSDSNGISRRSQKKTDREIYSRRYSILRHQSQEKGRPIGEIVTMRGRTWEKAYENEEPAIGTGPRSSIG